MHKAQDPLRQDQSARQDEPPAADEAVYEALYAALASTARGRAFLDEVARRARNADTLAALGALARIEAKLSDRLNDRLDDKATDKTDAPQSAATPSAAPAAMSEVDEEPFAGIPSDEAYVPFELEEPDVPEAQPETVSAPPAATAERPSSADVLARVMAMSPEERIALFS